jgi:hypothetical protein
MTDKHSDARDITNTAVGTAGGILGVIGGLSVGMIIIAVIVILVLVGACCICPMVLLWSWSSSGTHNAIPILLSYI